MVISGDRFAHRAPRDFLPRENGRTLRKYFAWAVDKRCVWRYNQELQDDCISRKKGKRAFFDIIDPHQGPDHLDVPPAPVWRLKLPNSLESGIWSMDEFGSCPAGSAREKFQSSNSQTPSFLRLFAELQDPRHLRPGSWKLVHRIVELAIDLNLDSCYKGN